MQVTVQEIKTKTKLKDTAIAKVLKCHPLTLGRWRRLNGGVIPEKFQKKAQQLLSVEKTHAPVVEKKKAKKTRPAKKAILSRPIEGPADEKNSKVIPITKEMMTAFSEGEKKTFIIITNDRSLVMNIINNDF
jgi:hypothetical protein